MHFHRSHHLASVYISEYDSSSWKGQRFSCLPETVATGLPPDVESELGQEETVEAVAASFHTGDTLGL